MKLQGASVRHLSGWTGGVVEGTEPDSVPSPYGSIASGLNMQTAPLGRLAVRGGSRVLLTFAEDDISEVLGVWPWSPTGAIAIAYDGTADKHYAYALTDEMGFALGTPITELDSRVDLGWDTNTPGRPVAVELFETLYVSDASITGRRAFSALTLVGGVLTLTTPTYNLGGSGAEAALPYTLASYNSSLFLAGWDSDLAPDAPHILRNSLIGTNPVDAGGFDVDGYAVIGAQGQRITAMEPGREILLVAKAGELYRVFGTGQALPGWFYSIQQVENTQGFGVTNPYALKHINSFWYGIGLAGPFRTNGSTVDPLGIPWRESWGRVDRLDLAWIAHHPDPTRRKVWFGFHETGQPLRPEVPFTIWAWDLERETWSPPHRGPRSYHLVNTIIPGTNDAPSGVPTLLEQRFDNGDWGFAEASGRFAAGDLDAMTEVWVRAPGGAYTLHTTLPAGIQRFRLAVTPAAVTSIRLRHTKNGVTTDFAGAVLFYPRLPAPTITLDSPVPMPAVIQALVFNPITGSTVTVRPTSGAWQETEADLAIGTFTVPGIDADSCLVTTHPDPGATIQAQLEHPSWPSGRDQSRIEEMVTHAVGCFVPPTGSPLPASHVYGPVVRQKLEGGGMQPTSITVRFQPILPPNGYTYEVQYKLASDLTWTTHSTVATPASPPTTLEVTISGLTAGRKYHVRVVDVTFLATYPTESTGVEQDCFTTLPVPVQAVAVIGSVGNPLTRITLTAPYNGASIASYNARETYSAVYTGQPGTPVSYDTAVGTCGRPDRFTARTYDPTWPDGFQFSEAVFDDIEDPCVP